MVRRRLVLLVACFAVTHMALSEPRALTLQEAIDLALSQNRTIAMAHKDTQHFEELKRKARADYFPRITNSSEVTHITDREGIVLPAGSLGAPATTGPIPATAIRIDQGGDTTYFSRTQLVQPLTQLFSIHEANRAAAADVHRSAAAEEDTRIDTVANVHKYFYGLMVARLQLQAAEDALVAARERDHEVAAALREGSALEADLLKAHAQLSQAETAVVDARAQAHQQAVQLNTLLSLAADTPIDPEPPLAVTDGTSGLPDRAGALPIALTHEPHVLEAEQEVEKARASLRLAENAYIPSITALTHESYQSGVALFVHNYGVFAGEINIDLFDGGKRRSEVKDAKLLLMKAQLALEEQREQTRASVEVTYDQVDEAQADLAAKRQSSIAAVAAENEALSRFRNGEILPSERDAAVATRASAQAATLESELNVALARVQVQRVLGRVPR